MPKKKDKEKIKSETALTGMCEIAQYLNLSHPTILKLHREYDLPISKLDGIWISDRVAIDKWRQKRYDPHGRYTNNN